MESIIVCGSDRLILECEHLFLRGGQVATQALDTLTNGNRLGTQVGAITGGIGKYPGVGHPVSPAALAIAGETPVACDMTEKR